MSASLPLALLPGMWLPLPTTTQAGQTTSCEFSENPEPPEMELLSGHNWLQVWRGGRYLGGQVTKGGQGTTDGWVDGQKVLGGEMENS